MEQLINLIDKLKFKGIAKCVEQTITQAQREGSAIQDVLLQLLEAEYQHRKEQALNYRFKQAKIPWNWTLDTFPFTKQPGLNKMQIMSLAKLDFIQKNENIIFIGSTGTGKTGLAIGILNLALINGYRGRFYNAQELLDELYTSLADKSTSRLLKQIANYDLLIIDELGYLTLEEEQVNIFFKLIDMRYSHKPTIITTNLAYPAWYDIFKNNDLVDAMLDRLKHYSTTIKITGDKSLRDPVSSVTS